MEQVDLSVDLLNSFYHNILHFSPLRKELVTDLPHSPLTHPSPLHCASPVSSSPPVSLAPPAGSSFLQINRDLRSANGRKRHVPGSVLLQTLAV